jgi:hypothetical protein
VGRRRGPECRIPFKLSFMNCSISDCDDPWPSIISNDHNSDKLEKNPRSPRGLSSGVTLGLTLGLTPGLMARAGEPGGPAIPAPVPAPAPASAPAGPGPAPGPELAMSSSSARLMMTGEEEEESDFGDLLKNPKILLLQKKKFRKEIREKFGISKFGVKDVPENFRRGWPGGVFFFAGGEALGTGKVGRDPEAGSEVETSNSVKARVGRLGGDTCGPGSPFRYGVWESPGPSPSPLSPLPSAKSPDPSCLPSSCLRYALLGPGTGLGGLLRHKIFFSGDKPLATRPPSSSSPSSPSPKSSNRSARPGPACTWTFRRSARVLFFVLSGELTPKTHVRQTSKSQYSSHSYLSPSTFELQNAQ